MKRSLVVCLAVLISANLVAATFGYDTSSIPSLAKSIIEERNAQTRAEKIVVLFMFVRDQISYDSGRNKTGFDTRLTRTPMQTVRNGSGNCGEQSRLLCALFYAIGEKAYYVHILIRPGLGHQFVGINASKPEAAYMSYLTGGEERYVMFPGKMWNGTTYLTIGPILPMDTTYPRSYIGFMGDYNASRLELYASWGDYAVVPEFPSGNILIVVVASLAVVILARRRLPSVVPAQTHLSRS